MDLNHYVRSGTLVGQEVQDRRLLSPQSETDQVMRLTPVMGLVVEQMGEHLVDRLRLRCAAGRGVVEGFRKACLAQVVDERDDPLVLRAPRGAEVAEILVKHLVQSRAARAYPLQAAQPQAVRHEEVVEGPEKRPEEGPPGPPPTPPA